MSFHNKDSLGELKSREPQTPAQLEAEKAKAKLAAVKLMDPPWLDCSEGNLYEVMCGQAFGIKNFEHDPGSKKVRFLRYNPDLSKMILDAVQKIADSKTFPIFVKYFESLKKLAVATQEAEEIDRETRTSLEKKFFDDRGAGIVFAEKSVSERRADQILQAELKRQPQRVFSPEEKEKGIDWQALSGEDLERSRKNLITKKNKINNQIGEVEKKISKFGKEIEPFNEKIVALQALLDGDLTEEKFKDLKLSREYNQLIINKIQDKISPLEAEKTALQNEIDQIDGQVQILNCVVDKLALERESVNWQNRRKRALERVYKVLNDRDGLIQLRISLNEKWKLLTNDTIELVPPLCLKADSELFFL